MPTYYDGLVWRARLAGTATVDITIGKEGSPETIAVRGVAELLKGMISVQIKRSKFSLACARRTVRYVFEYRLAGRDAPAPTNALQFRPPNHFIITSSPPIPQNLQ